MVTIVSHLQLSQNILPELHGRNPLSFACVRLTQSELNPALKKIQAGPAFINAIQAGITLHPGQS